MQQGGEPSLEEILASIKKVMAREEVEAARQRDRASSQGIEPADEDEAADVLDLGEAGILIVEDGPGGDGWAQVPPSGAAVGRRSDAPKLPGRDPAVAIRESLAALERLSAGGATPQFGGSADASLEALTRAMLRPMLSEWLEAHLPEIVERQVQAEITRIVGRQG